MGDMVRQWGVVPVHQATYQGPGQFPNLQNAIFLSIYRTPFSPSRFPLPYRLYPSFSSLPQIPPRSLVAAHKDFFPKKCSETDFFQKNYTDLVHRLTLSMQCRGKLPRGAQW